jgi:hypothetical protein
MPHTKSSPPISSNSLIGAAAASHEIGRASGQNANALKERFLGYNDLQDDLEEH